MNMLFSVADVRDKANFTQVLDKVIKENPSWDDISHTFSSGILIHMAIFQYSPYVWDKILNWINMTGTDEGKRTLIKITLDNLNTIDFSAFGIWDKINDLINTINDEKIKLELKESILQQHENLHLQSTLALLSSYQSDRISWRQLSELIKTTDEKDEISHILSLEIIEGYNELHNAILLRIIYTQGDPVIWDIVLNLIKMTSPDQQKGILKMIFSDGQFVNRFIKSIYLHDPMFLKILKKLLINLAIDEELRQECIAKLFHADLDGNSTLIATMLQEQPDVSDVIEIIIDLILLGNADEQLGLIKQVFNKADKQVHPRIFYKLAKDAPGLAGQLFDEKYSITDNYSDYFKNTIQNIDLELPLPADFYEQIKKLVEFMPTNELIVVDQTPKEVEGVELFSLYDIRYEDILEKLKTLVASDITNASIVRTLLMRVTIEWKSPDELLTNSVKPSTVYPLINRKIVKGPTMLMLAAQYQYKNTEVWEELLRLVHKVSDVNARQELVQAIFLEEDKLGDTVLHSAAFGASSEVWQKILSLFKIIDDDETKQKAIKQILNYNARKTEYQMIPIDSLIWKELTKLLECIKDETIREKIINDFFIEFEMGKVIVKNYLRYPEIWVGLFELIPSITKATKQILICIAHKTKYQKIPINNLIWKELTKLLECIKDETLREEIINNFFIKSAHINDKDWDIIFELFEIASPNQQLELFGRVFEITSQKLSADVYVELAKKIINTKALESELVTADEQAILQHFSDIQLQSVKKAFRFTDKELHPKIFYELAQNTVLAKTLFKEKSGLFATYQDIFINLIHRILDNSYELPQDFADDFLEQLIVLAQNTDDKTGLSGRLQVKSYFPRLNCKELNQWSVQCILHNKKPYDDIYKILCSSHIYSKDTEKIKAIKEQLDEKSKLDIDNNDNTPTFLKQFKRSLVDKETVHDLFNFENFSGDDSISLFIEKVESAIKQKERSIIDIQLHRIDSYIELAEIIGWDGQRQKLQTLKQQLDEKLKQKPDSDNGSGFAPHDIL